MIFPKVIVPLQKYLRLTRLQHLHPPDNILSRLSTSIAHNCSPAAFLAVYSLGKPFTTITAAFASAGLPVQRRSHGGCNGEVHRTACCQSQLHRPASCSAGGVKCCSSGPQNVHLLQSWCLSSETLPLSRPLQPGTRFRLSRAGVTLFCTVHANTLFQLKRSSPPASSNQRPLAPLVHISHKKFPETRDGVAEISPINSVHTKSPTPVRPTVQI
ncbi:unnamed protein product [Schistocephalus solidus]|uniref:Uncharacterized protein n=1 Tax=Schistocephalus solidus TaxID=70667 RepID=A0A183SYJ0_SCHSO|nr:unnamed protein product [Schistocephalus solidus]